MACVILRVALAISPAILQFPNQLLFFIFGNKISNKKILSLPSRYYLCSSVTSNSTPSRRLLSVLLPHVRSNGSIANVCGTGFVVFS